MRAVLIPLDSRPCNRLFPAQLLTGAGIQCVTPPAEALDCFVAPGDHAALSSFLMKAAREADVLILSLEQWVYGSLLASREDSISEVEALSRLTEIRRLKEVHPALRVLASSVVMRSSISTLKAEDLAHHFAVNEYAKAAYRGDSAQTAKLAREIPARILDKYRCVRARNHRVNQAALSMCAEGTVDKLLLLQEDSQPEGLHRLEQEALTARIQAENLGDRVALHNGTDESGCLLAVLAAAKPLKLHIHALGGEPLDFIAKYEDRAFIENIRSQCRFAGIELTDAAHADKVLCVLTPGQLPQRDLVFSEAEGEDGRARFSRLASEMAEWMRGGKPVGLLDVAVANGGCLPFLDQLAGHISPWKLAAYSAWNTACNALGTVLAQLALLEEGAANTAFTVERLLDDALYQGQVRQMLNGELSALGEDVLHLSDWPRADALLSSLMDKVVRASPLFAGLPVHVSVKLPWPRTFEAEIAWEKECMPDGNG